MTKILLVEDDKSLREIYGVRLLAEGFDIVSAGDGEEALAMAIKEKPGLIISDVMMPKISGFDMLDILRSTTETRDIKVIMMTALSSEDQRTRGEQLGADKYLVKSQVGIEDVVRAVHEVLGTKSPNEQKSDSDTSSDTSADNQNTSDPTATTSAPASNNTSLSNEQTIADKVDETPAPTADNSTELGSSADDKPKEDSSMPPAGEDAAPTSASDSSDPATAAPGNEDAGPLPPQPTELESELPQPTAPFSSPRPANLGENVMNPTDMTNPVNGDAGVPVPPPSGDGSVPPVPPAPEPLQATPAAPEAPAMPPVPEVPLQQPNVDENQQPPVAPGTTTPPAV